MTQSKDNIEFQKSSIEKPKKNKWEILREELFDLFSMFFISYLIISLFDENILTPEKLYTKGNITLLIINALILIFIHTILFKKKIILKESSFWAFALKRLMNLYPTSLKIFSSSFILFSYFEFDFSNPKNNPSELYIIFFIGIGLFIVNFIIVNEKESFFQ
jgi:hypothetical protein